MPSSSKNGSNATKNTNSRQIMNDILPRPKKPTPQEEIHPRSKKRTRTPEEELARQIVPKLASRSYHLPGYSLRQDWFQYMFNNHPLFGIFCHHRLHPLKMRQRLIILLGSFSFGVMITNAIFLYFVGSGRDDKEQVFALDVSAMSAQQSTSQTFSVTSGVLMLVTVGSGTHAIFDRFVWSLSACGCCRAGGRFENLFLRGCCKSVGYYLVIFLVVAVVALATCIVVIRASVEEGVDHNTMPSFVFQNQTEVTEKENFNFNELINDFDAQDYSFLKGYALEFGVSLFIYYPIVETVLFSGIIGCGRIPIFGGRPFAMRQEAKMQSIVVRHVCPTELA